MRGVILVGLLIMGWAPAVLAQRAGAPGLGVDGLVAFRDQGSVAVLAEATSFWRPVATKTEELLGDFRYLPEYASARAQGQIFKLVDSDAAKLVADSDGRFVVVPWSFGLGCAEEGWESPEWVPPGDTVAFLLVPTRTRSSSAGGSPVFDVLGWHQPYPVGELIPFWRKGLRVNPDWLSAQDFYELLTVLPSEMAFYANREAALAPFLKWVRARPERTSTFPVPEIQDRWQAEGNGGRLSP